MITMQGKKKTERPIGVTVVASLYFLSAAPVLLLTGALLLGVLQARSSLAALVGCLMLLAGFVLAGIGLLMQTDWGRILALILASMGAGSIGALVYVVSRYEPSSEVSVVGWLVILSFLAILIWVICYLVPRDVKRGFGVEHQKHIQLPIGVTLLASLYFLGAAGVLLLAGLLLGGGIVHATISLTALARLLIVAPVLAIAGIGLLLLVNWGRMLAVILAFAAIVLIGVLVYVFASDPPSEVPVGVWLVILSFLAFFVWNLHYLLRADVKQAFGQVDLKN